MLLEYVLFGAAEIVLELSKTCSSCRFAQL